MKGQTSYKTRRHHENQKAQSHVRPDTDNNLKTVLGEIAELDPNSTGKLFCTVWVKTPTGQGRRLWGDGRLVAIVDSPVDILLRFGQLRSGMKILISWHGISETGAAWGRILGEADEVQEVEQIPQRQVDTNSSLPFEPLGIL